MLMPLLRAKKDCLSMTMFFTVLTLFAQVECCDAGIGCSKESGKITSVDMDGVVPKASTPGPSESQGSLRGKRIDGQLVLSTMSDDECDSGGARTKESVECEIDSDVEMDTTTDIEGGSAQAQHAASSTRIFATGSTTTASTTHVDLLATFPTFPVPFLIDVTVQQPYTRYVPNPEVAALVPNFVTQIESEAEVWKLYDKVPVDEDKQKQPRYGGIDLAFLGEGAFGKVYKVRSKADGNEYALKIVDISNSDVINAELTVSYPSIFGSVPNSSQFVKFKETFLWPDDRKMDAYTISRTKICFVMDLCKGGSLQDYMNEKLPVIYGDPPTYTVERRIEEAKPIMRSILSALKTAHDHKLQISHNDLKADNIGLMEKGNIESLALIDWSLVEFGSEQGLRNDVRKLVPLWELLVFNRGYHNSGLMNVYGRPEFLETIEPMRKKNIVQAGKHEKHSAAFTDVEKTYKSNMIAFYNESVAKYRGGKCIGSITTKPGMEYYLVCMYWEYYHYREMVRNMPVMYEKLFFGMGCGIMSVDDVLEFLETNETVLNFSKVPAGFSFNVEDLITMERVKLSNNSGEEGERADVHLIGASDYLPKLQALSPVEKQTEIKKLLVGILRALSTAYGQHGGKLVGHEDIQLENVLLKTDLSDAFDDTDISSSLSSASVMLTGWGKGNDYAFVGEEYIRKDVSAIAWVWDELLGTQFLSGHWLDLCDEAETFRTFELSDISQLLQKADCTVREQIRSYTSKEYRYREAMRGLYYSDLSFLDDVVSDRDKQIFFGMVTGIMSVEDALAALGEDGADITFSNIPRPKDGLEFGVGDLV